MKHVRIIISVLLVCNGYVYAPNTQADKAFAANLFKKVEKDKSLGFTQSEAQLSLPAVQTELKHFNRLAEREKIIKQALYREREHVKGYYVFYSAVPYMMLFQDVAKWCYERNNPNKLGAFKNNAFQFIRYTFNDLIYSQYPDVTDFLIKEILTNGIVDDNQVRLKTILVSTNLAFFGNADLRIESTWHYFNNPQPWGKAKREWLEACLTSYGYSTMLVEELVNLSEMIKTDTGDLFQFFIPKNLVNKIGYLSWRQGIPFDHYFISQVFERKVLKFDQSDAIYGKEINDRIAAFKTQWKNHEPKAIKLADHLLKNVKAGKYLLEPFLEKYEQMPQSLPYLTYYEARLLITNDLLLNPESGIKIYRYSTLPFEKRKAYEVELKKVMEQIYKESSKKPVAAAA